MVSSWFEFAVPANPRESSNYLKFTPLVDYFPYIGMTDFKPFDDLLNPLSYTTF